LTLGSGKQVELSDVISAVDVAAQALSKTAHERDDPSVSTNPYVICCIPFRNQPYLVTEKVLETFLYRCHEMALQAAAKSRQKGGVKQPIECVSWSEHP
jgi:hypothetical protein